MSVSTATPTKTHPNPQGTSNVKRRFQLSQHALSRFRSRVLAKVVDEKYLYEKTEVIKQLFHNALSSATLEYAEYSQVGTTWRVHSKQYGVFRIVTVQYRPDLLHVLTAYLEDDPDPDTNLQEDANT